MRMFMAGLCLFGMMLVNTFALAETPASIEVNAWVEPSQDIIVSQQLILNIEVSTPTYFVGGTRLLRPEVEGAVVLQREAFAVNSTRRVDGVTWAVQLWTMTVFPQRGGAFTVPPIKIEARVAGSDGQPKSVSSLSSPVRFDAQLPEGVPGDAPWLATSSFSVEEQYDKALDGLELGDAVTRVITFRARDLAAMMLPELDFGARVDGLSVYPNPPVLNDKVNRGDYVAERTEQITYVIEKPGSFVLPERRFYWFDLATGEFNVEVLPEATITTTLSLGYYLRLFVESCLGFIADLDLTEWLLLLVLGTVLVYSRRPLTKAVAFFLRVLRARKQRIKLEKEFVELCRNGHYKAAASTLYRWFDLAPQPSNVHSVQPASSVSASRTIRGYILGFDSDFVGPDRSSLLAEHDALMERAFAKASDGASDSDAAIFKRFIKEMHRLQSRYQSSGFKRKPIDLRLN